jgi:hypothetical protein
MLMPLNELGQGTKIIKLFTTFIQLTLPRMGARSFSRGKGRPAHKADDLTAVCELIV